MADPNPDLFAKNDFIRRFMQDPCDAPYSAYALAMLGAALESFVLLNAVDYQNMFFSALQSAAGISRRRSGRKGMSGTKARRWSKTRRAYRLATADPSSQIGHYIGKASPLAKKPLPGFLGILFLIYGLIDFANFLTFLVEIITQFLFRFMSLLWNSKYCQARDDAVALLTGPTYTVAAIIGPTLLVVPTVEKLRGDITVFRSSVTVPPGYSGVMTCGFFAQPTGTTLATKVIVRLRQSDFIDFAQRWETDIVAPNIAACGGEWAVSSSGSFQMTVELTNGFALLSDPWFYVHLTEDAKKPVTI